MRSLLVTDFRRFAHMVADVRQGSGCGCAPFAIVEKQELRRYEFGTDKCSKTRPGSCGIAQFLAVRVELVERILTHFRSLPPEKKSGEIKNAETFLGALASQPQQVHNQDPCLTVGDLLIA